MFHKLTVSYINMLVNTIKGRLTNHRSCGIFSKSGLNLEYIPWFSVAGFSAVFVFCIAFGLVLTHFMVREILTYDASITSRFVSGVEWVESKQAQFKGKEQFGKLLDPRTNYVAFGIDPNVATAIRTQYFDHISKLPDVKLVSVFARDRTIIWSTNPSLIGMLNKDNDELEEAIAKRAMVSTNSFDGEHEKTEQQFVSEPETPFVETYIPLLDSMGDVSAVVELYQEPENLAQTIHNGKLLIWTCILLGASFLYIIPLWIFRRVDNALMKQQQRLREAEALCVIGEMSATIAHGIRNPLATIRSSAELALDAEPEAARKNAEDIIVQVDRLSKWIRDLLVFTRPVSGENEAVNLVTLVDECLLNYTVSMRKKGIVSEFVRSTELVPLVIGNRVLATQALASIISNAIDAMPNGGALSILLEVSTFKDNVDIVVTDTGAGMSPAQVELAFKPFYTTKHNGIGLGMSQVRRIMERFGGNASLHSQEGKGTKACLRFRQEHRST